MILLSVAVVMVAGLAVMALLRIRTSCGWTLLGAAFFLGVITLALWTHLLLVVRIPISFYSIVASPVLLIALARWKGDRSVLRVPWTRPTLWSIPIVAACLFAIAGALSWSLLGWDGEYFYILKAKSIMHYGTFMNPDFMEEARLHLAKRRPLLLPSIYTDFFMLESTMDHRILRLWFALIHIGGLCVLYERAKPSPIWMTVFAWFPVLWHDSGGAFTAYADATLGILFLLGFDALRTKEHGLAIVSLTAAVLLKQDAWPFLIALALATSLTFPSQLRTWLPVLAVPAAVVIAWVLIARHLPWSLDFNPNQFSVENVSDSIERWPLALRGFGSKMVSLKHWGVFWILGVLAVIAWWRRLNRDDARWLLVILFQLLAYTAVFATYSAEEIRLIARAQLMRLLLHLAPLFWMWLCSFSMTGG